MTWWPLVSDDLIENKGPKVIASILIELVETAPGQTGTRVQQTCPDEIACFGLLEKGRQICAMLFAQHYAQNAPRVGLAHGIPDSIKRHLRG